MAKPIITMVMRLVIIVAAVAAVIMMLTSSQRVKFQNGLIFTVKYYNFGSFKFFLMANIVFSLYSFVTIFLPAGSPLWRTVLCFDVVMGMLISASIGTTWTYYNLLNKGNINVPWGPICPITPRFCSGVLGAFIAGIIGFSFHFILMAYSFQKIFNPALSPE